ncbi:DUF3310 domain-containing protein [uncultured Mitsuokella sp.]|uniref:DUF3310 domain-containing protein n=1 Tax=uncultured Mitsuokella sp. TaxID=453120 RepID=UPI0026DD3E60|nr:DUF3310 domain-containing protein [uncultured Mitsuokella sp.]
MSFEVGDRVRVVQQPKTLIDRPAPVLYKYIGRPGEVTERVSDWIYAVKFDDMEDDLLLADTDLEPAGNGDAEREDTDKMEDQNNDVIEHPSHYTQGIECMDYIESHKLNYARGNIIKYVTRAGLKDASKEVEDLEKARWYLDREIERVKAVKEGICK